ncbi:MAG: hypothetical protein JNK15_07410 [Planctomycetes bacterium]|nr:hypothetical protein [Planctomycetota bacterium]
MIRQLALVSFAATIAATASAQCFNGTGGTSIGGTIAATGSDPAHDEGRSPLTALGFAFPMPGAGTFTDCVIDANGLIYLANGANPPFLGTYVWGSASSLAGAAGSGPRIAPFWRDIWAMPAGWDVTTTVVPGTSFKVTWLNTTDYFSTSPARSFSATLFATGEVEFSYDYFTVTSTFVGIGTGNGVGTGQPVSNLAGNPSGGTVPMMYETFSAANWDLSGRSIRFVPNAGGGYDVITPCATLPASHTAYGSGCYTASDSVYQAFATAAPAAAALSNTAITFTPTGGGQYVVTNGGTFLPVGSVQAVPTIVANGDDTEQVVPFTTGSFPGSTGLAICSNGFVSLAAGNSTTWNQTAALLLNGSQTSFRAAHDMNPTLVGSGQIKYEESASVTMVTWDGVWDFAGSSAADANTIQIQMYPSGQVVIAWGSLSSLGASGIGHYVGYSPAGPSFDAGSIDLATQLPFVTSSANLTPMTLSATPAPVSTGVSGTLVTYTQGNIPEAAPASGVYLGITAISIGQDLPGTDLFFIGMPGCKLHITSLDVTLAFVGGANSLTTQFQIPAGVPYGTQLFAQSAAIVAPNSLPNGQNAFGATLSNAVASFISFL